MGRLIQGKSSTTRKDAVYSRRHRTEIGRPLSQAGGSGGQLRPRESRQGRFLKSPARASHRPKV